jgi:ABC-type lipopolysaccharide export system ATPase subunit
LIPAGGATDSTARAEKTDRRNNRRIQAGRMLGYFTIRHVRQLRDLRMSGGLEEARSLGTKAYLLLR